MHRSSNQTSCECESCCLVAGIPIARLPRLVAGKDIVRAIARG
ncbi:hypothetical protein Y88_0361 [Novosphingobium nitrogenifigens DSM 19370]|uniref:Uncharacterized protein n=1 Tax=Novosphingobium nitrogenifigens DSM 19370 TaxID=983920 RepID=F1ZAQ6_9SPHN|nr:hypothetical protein Y88_0361 [Novosphingobium nitrogenifigens DSM 19370]